MNQPPLAFWSLSTTELLQQLQTTPEGLTGAEARIFFTQDLRKNHFERRIPELLGKVIIQ